MAKILKVVGADNRGKYAVVHVILDDGTEAECYVGGECEVFFDPTHNKIKAFIKRRKYLQPVDKTKQVGVDNKDKLV